MGTDAANFKITTSVSLGLWVKLAAKGQQAKLISKNSYGLEIGNGGGNDIPIFVLSGVAAMGPISPMGINDLNWHHFVGVIDGVNCYVYIDGRLVHQVAQFSFASDNTNKLTIGADPGGASYLFNGQMKYPFVCAQALTSAEVTDVFGFGPVNNGLANYLSTRSVRGLWSFNGVYTDLSGNGNTLTPTGTPTFTNVSGTNFGRGLRTVA